MDSNNGTVRRQYGDEEKDMRKMPYDDPNSKVKPVWSDEEKDILIDKYTALGPKALWQEGLLPGRTRSSIQRMARRLGVKFNNIAETERPDRSRASYAKRKFGFHGKGSKMMKLAVCGRWR